MSNNFIKPLIDFAKLKMLKKYLNTRPGVLKILLNVADLFRNGNHFKCMLLRFLGAKIGKNVTICNNVHILMPEYLEIGDYSIIGDNSTIMCYLHKIHIGKFSLTAVNTTFIAGSHRTDNYDNLNNQDIYIGNGVWIGASSTIMGGAKVNKGCIIGAASLVRGQEFPDFSIIAGVPAKIIKKREITEIVNQPIKYNIKELDYD